MELHGKNNKVAGVSLEKAEMIMLMLHGRGGTAEDIISIAKHLHIHDTHIIAPQATNNSWYPNSFMAPVDQNQPWLKSSLDLLKEIVRDIQLAGIKSEQIYIVGFSQGACLGLEFAAQNAMKFGGIVAFTGGLIGEVIDTKNYKGNFNKTKLFIGNSDRDPHVPLIRSRESKKIMEDQGAEVTLKIYRGMGHTINEDEINWVNQYILL
jgi:phospholipase/carboxylesterase